MTTPVTSEPVSSSFRDPSGFVITSGGTIYRQVNASYKGEYDRLMESGLYASLTREGLLVEHEEVSLERRHSDLAYKVLEPARIPFVSYPYEWCFSQLKEAALLTLRIQRTALDHGMSLKDASAYNVQFVGCSPVFIDTLSFETYNEGRPWVAYRQFCQHFLAPLALMSRVDVRLGHLLKSYVDGIPLDLASGLLPARTRASFAFLTHIHLHAKSQARFADRPVKASTLSTSKLSLVGILESLRHMIERLSWSPKGTEWVEYYENTNYLPDSMHRKAEIVESYLDRAAPESVWDMGANTGLFSRIATAKGARTVAFDVDPAAVEKNFLAGAGAGEQRLLPLLLDVTNPSPGIGWENDERPPLVERGPADLMLALALVHHLAIGNNVPLERVARFFARLASWLVIEFVPKEDSQVRRLLASREDVFPQYHQAGFEEAFQNHFTIVDTASVDGTERTLYLMRSEADERA